MTQDEIIALIRSCATETVDWDLHGNKLTDADVALWGAHGPLMMRVVRAAQRQAYERAAEVCVSKEIPFDIEDWINWTKRDVSSETALALSTAIRALIEGDSK